MVTFKFLCGFGYILRDGEEIANTGDDWHRKAVNAGFTKGCALERICRWMGGDVAEAYDQEFNKPVAKPVRRNNRRGCMMRGF